VSYEGGFKQVADDNVLNALREFENYILTPEYAVNDRPNPDWAAVSKRLKELTETAAKACRESLDKDRARF